MKMIIKNEEKGVSVTIDTEVATFQSVVDKIAEMKKEYGEIETDYVEGGK